MSNNTRRKGFSFLSFLIGILFGMIILAGSLVGVIYYALSTSVDKALSLAGMDNKDEEGNSVYINTDLDTGGAESLLDLVTKISAMASNPGDISVGQVEKLIPALSGMVDGLYTTVNRFVPMERSELAAVNFSGLGAFVQTKILEAEPAVLFTNFGMEGMLENRVVSLVLVGSEAKYVENGEEKYPVWYDKYELVEDVYKRVDDGEILPEEYVENLVEKGEYYALYYYMYTDGNAYITDDDFTFVNPVAKNASGQSYTIYNEEYKNLSGNFYYEGENKITVNPITIGSLSESGGVGALNEVYLTEFISEGNPLTGKVLGKVTLGDVVTGKFQVDSSLNALPLTDIMQIKADDSFMLKLVWKLTDVVKDKDGNYTGIYEDEGVEYVCDIRTEIAGEGEDAKENVVGASYKKDGKTVEVKCLTVGEMREGLNISDLIDDITIAEVLDIKAPESIMAYIGYGLYGIEENEGVYTAKFDLTDDEGNVLKDGEDNIISVECIIETEEDGKISSVYYLDGEEPVRIKSVSIKNISSKINDITKKLTIKEITGESEDPILNKLGAYTVDKISDGIDTLTIGDVIKDTNGNKMLEKLHDTQIKDLPEAIDSLKMSEIMDIEESNTVLYKLKDATIKTLPSAIDNLMVNDIYAGEIYKDGEKEAVLRLAVSGTPEKENEIAFNEDYIYYENIDGVFTVVNIEGNEKGKLTQAQFEVGRYYTYGEAQGVWKMLLYKKIVTEDGEEYKTESVYTINGLTGMIGNVSDNMSKSTLRELHDAEILIFSNPESLDKKIPYVDGDGNPAYSEPIGEMGLMDFINFVIINVSEY